MKKTLALILALIMMLSLAACGGDGSKEPDNSGNTPSTPTDTPSTSDGEKTEVQDVTLKIWTASEELELMKKMGESFAAAHPSPRSLAIMVSTLFTSSSVNMHLL